MGFFSSRSLKTREKYISFAQLVLLSSILSFKNWKVNTLPTKNIQTEQNQIFRTFVSILTFQKFYLDFDRKYRKQLLKRSYFSLFLLIQTIYEEPLIYGEHCLALCWILVTS